MKHHENEPGGSRGGSPSPAPRRPAGRRDRPDDPEDPAPRSKGMVVTIEVGAAEPPEHLFRRLLGAYLAGARGFVIRDHGRTTPATRGIVRSFCRRTRQPEVVSDEGGVLRLEDLAFDRPVSLDQRLARMGRLVIDFHREAVESWQGLPLGEERYWERRDDEIDREAWYIQRIASLRLGEDRPHSGLLGGWTVARSLERIADHAVILGTVGPRLVGMPSGTGPATPLRQFHAQAMEHLDGVLSAGTSEDVNALLDTGEALIDSGHTLADRLLPGVGNGTMAPAAAAAVARLLESIGRTIAYAQDIAQVALDRPGPWLRFATPAESSSSLVARGRRGEGGDRSREAFLTPPAP
jgi:hypothetical protein